MFKILISLLLSFFIVFGNAQITDRFYIQLKSNTVLSNEHWEKINSNSKDIPFSFFDFLPELNSLDIAVISRPFPLAIESTPLLNTFIVHLNKKMDISTLIDDLNRNGNLNYAEKILDDEIEFIPNDPYYSNSWWHTRINSPSAWDISMGDSKIVVAIVDDAVHISHPDLQNIIWVNEDEIPNNGIDDDLNGYIDDINGWDTGQNDNDPSALNASSNWDHGTHVAGIAGAETNNNIGVSSIGNGISIMALKAANASGSLSNTWDGLYYAGINNADIINCSWSSGTYSNTNQELVNWLADKGIIVVAAAGNYYNNLASSPRYPACYDNVICVANTNSSDVKVNSSNYGTQVDVSAPGSGIFSTVPFSTYASKTGTSMAAPMVSGLLGLMKSYAPDLENDIIIDCLQDECDDISSFNPSYNGLLGSGRINARASMQCLRNYMSTPLSADFSSSENLSCTGFVQFSDETQGFTNKWEWDFNEDGIIDDTSSNPVYAYSKNGIYDVALKVFNLANEDSVVKNQIVEINLSSAPNITDLGICQGDQVTLTSENNVQLNWFENEGDVTPFLVSNEFNSSQVISDTTFFVSTSTTTISQQVGIPNFNGQGTNFTSNVFTDFTVYKPLYLSTLDVKCFGGFNRTIQILDENDKVIFNKVFQFSSNGVHTLSFNTLLFPGNYKIGMGFGSVVSFFRSTSNVNYPYVIPNLISITGNSMNQSQYYFFYNWQVSELPCQGERASVQILVDSCLGVSSLQELVLYPNPNDGQFTLRVPKNMSGNLTLYNTHGQRLIDTPFSALAERVELAVNGLSKGIYFLKVYNDSESITKKIMVYD